MCQTIRIGENEYEPEENVVIADNGIQIIAPRVKEPMNNVVLNIKKQEVVKVAYSFSQDMSMIFIWLLPSCSQCVRGQLEMEQPGEKLPAFACNKIILLLVPGSDALNDNDSLTTSSSWRSGASTI